MLPSKLATFFKHFIEFHHDIILIWNVNCRVELRAMSDDKKKEDDAEDERLEFLLNYLTKSYKLKQEKWNKMIGVDENRVRQIFFSL